MSTLRDVDDVIGDHHGLSRKVLDYSRLMGRLVGEAKQPGFSDAGWAPLEDLIETEGFVRVGNFKEVMNWAQYVSFLTSWATAAEWECSFRRITELPNLVFLELEERSRIGDFHSVVNSMSVYEFNSDGKIARMDIYLQMALPSMEMPEVYDGVELAE